MASQPTFSFLDEITGEKDSWLIKVKIHLLWSVTYKKTPNNVSSLDMILMDSKGNKIHASVKKNLIPLYADVLKEDTYVEISEFGVGDYGGMYMMVDQSRKINFYKGTKVRRSNPFENSVDAYTPVLFSDLLEFKQNPHVAFDIVGQLVCSKDFTIVTEKGFTTKQISVVLQDESGKRLNCSLWGEYASSIHSYLDKNNGSSEPIIVFIQMAKVKTWLGQPQVGNSLFGSRIHINEDIKPINDFVTRIMSGNNRSESMSTALKLSSKTVVTNPVDFYLEFPFKTIDEVLNMKTTMGCVVIANVIKVIVDEGWYYFSCKRCGKKAVERFPVVDDVVEYDCSECHIVKDVDRKVRTVIRVQDETGSASLVLFDKQLIKVLNSTSSWINNKMKSGDANVLPEEFDSLINKRVVFKIQVAAINLKKNGYDGFTAHKLTDDPEVILAIQKKKQLLASDENKLVVSIDEAPTKKRKFDDDQV